MLLSPRSLCPSLYSDNTHCDWGCEWGGSRGCDLLDTAAHAALAHHALKTVNRVCHKYSGLFNPCTHIMHAAR